ncbi:MAG: outer membrane beta-barrel protein [Legionellales bacterium]|nr:outer membrane beta-barrel protein [Legionellales bacterium]
MRLVHQFFLSCVLAGFVVPTFAGTWFLGGGIGRSHDSAKSSSFLNSPTLNNWNTGGKAFIGYQFNDNLAAEFQYMQFGAVKILNQGQIRNSTLVGDLVGILPIDRLIDIGASVGLAHVQYRIDNGIQYSDNLDRSPRSQLAFEYGLFAQYEIEQNAFVRLAWDQVLPRAKDAHMKLSYGLASINLVLNLGDTYDNIDTQA